MRRILGLLYFMCTLSAAADPLTIERIFADPALAGPTPRGVKIAPDGSRVGLLRGRADDQHQLDLWTYDLKTRALHLAVDSRKLLPNEQLSDVEKGRRERARIADLRAWVEQAVAEGRHQPPRESASHALCARLAPMPSLAFEHP
jgi:dipeptidyl-peptidase-4